MIIDCHTHWGRSWEKRDSGSPANWLKILDKHQIDKAFLFCEESLFDSSMVKTDNSRVAKLGKLHPDRIIPFGTVWPQHQQLALDEVKRCIEDLGMTGLKFHPWVQGFSTANETMGEICLLAEQYGVPIVFHDSTPPYSLSEQVAGLARRFPQTVIILGHAGGLWNWRSALEASKLPNIRICLTGPTMRTIEIFCQKVAPEKILWGSDFGFGLADSISYRLGLFMEANVGTELRQQILEVNPLGLVNYAKD